MGVINTKLKIRNPLRTEPPVEITAKVDTAATMLVLPEDLADSLGLTNIRTQTVKYANEETAERRIAGMVELEVCGRKGWFEAILEPKKTYALLGAVVMESLDLIVEPASLGLYPNPRSKLPMAEVE
ncbi:MAG TPA: aspartyl protease family protein [Planctomycetota bacterium]|nr:aspartyl protease family protein [Planctomycetota bacterium]